MKLKIDILVNPTQEISDGGLFSMKFSAMNCFSAF